VRPRAVYSALDLFPATSALDHPQCHGPSGVESDTLLAGGEPPGGGRSSWAECELGLAYYSND
jgi:hypothetical protein